MKELKINDIVVFEKRIYRVSLKPFSNGEKRGHRVQLILLREKELNSLILKNLELKGIIKKEEEEKKPYYCSKCQEGFKWEDMNNNEQEEYLECNDFVCSDCINDEMQKKGVDCI